MMNSRRSWTRRGLMGMGLAAPLALAPMLDVTVNAMEDPAAAVRHRAGATIDVTEVQADAATVTGTLINRTTESLQNVKLVVTDDFVFSGARKPGTAQSCL